MMPLMLCALAFGFYYYHRADDELRAFVQNKISEQYPDLSISVGGARIMQREGIRIRDISVVRPGDAANARSELAYIDEILLRCDPSLPALLQGVVDVERIYIRGLVLRPVREVDGTLNIANLLPLPCMGDPSKPSAPTTIEDATIEFIDRQTSPPSLISLNRVNLNLTPIADQSEGDTQLTQGESLASSQSAPLPTYSIEGNCSSNHFSEATVKAKFHPVNGLIVEGDVQSLRLAPGFYASMPHEVSTRLGRLLSLKATVGFSYQVRYSLRQHQLRFSIDGSVSDGRFELPQLDEAITEINSDIKLTHEAIHITDFSARFGAAKIAMSLQRQGYSKNAPMAVNVQARNFHMRRRMVDALPTELQVQWAKYQALGIINGTAYATFNGRQWNYDAAIDLVDVAFQYHRFPYPVHSSTGRIELHRNVLDVNVRSIAGTTPIRLTGKLTNPGPRATGWCMVKSERLMPIDDSLLDTIERRSETVSRTIRQMTPHGLLGVVARFTKNQPVEGPMFPSMTITVKDASVDYVRFPYPIHDVQGIIKLQGKRWTFSKLEGFNDSCFITCDGSFDATRRDRQLRLNFTANQISLDSELKAAVPVGVRRLWANLRPRGSVDRAEITLQHTRGRAQPTIYVSATKLPQSNDSSSEELSIRPTWFPYRIENLSANFDYEDGKLAMTRVRGRNQRTRISTNVMSHFDRRGNWRVTFDDMSVLGIQLNNELMRALPKELANPVRQLKVRGDLQMSGRLAFSGNGIPESTKSEWDLRMDIERGGITTGLEFTHAFGNVRLRGKQSNGELRNLGNLDLDSVMCRGVQLTAVGGPIWFDGKRFLGGSLVPVGRGKKAFPPLQATVHEGLLQANVDVAATETPRFGISAKLTDASLASITRDQGPNGRNLTGRIAGQLSLQGTAGGVHTLKGKGNARLQDANLYELPMILAVLKRLRFGDADTTAFTSSALDFQVQGDQIYFNQFDLAGDTITLKGIGAIGLDRQMQLDFYSIVGRENMWMPLVRPLLGEASRQFMLIKVRGSLDEPIARQEVLPGLNETLQRLFPEQSRSVRQANGSRFGRGLYR